MDVMQATVTRGRIATVILAPIAALIAWTVVRLIGVDLVVSSGDGNVGPGDVLTAALFGALAAWLVARLLERRSPRPRLWWARIGSTALAVSIIGPTWFADGASGVSLIGLHVVTAIVVITGFARTLSIRRGDTAR
jgi:heme A synthase